MPGSVSAEAWSPFSIRIRKGLLLRKEEASSADVCLNIFALYSLESLGVRHEVVGALSALEVNNL